MAHPPAWTISPHRAHHHGSYTQTDTTERAIDLALDVLKRLRENGITAEQLASAKAYVEGMFPPDRLETSAQLAAAVGELELFGLDRGEIDGLFARIDGVTPSPGQCGGQEIFSARATWFSCW